MFPIKIALFVGIPYFQTNPIFGKLMKIVEIPKKDMSICD